MLIIHKEREGSAGVYFSVIVTHSYFGIYFWLKFGPEAVFFAILSLSQQLQKNMRDRLLRFPSWARSGTFCDASTMPQPRLLDKL